MIISTVTEKEFLKLLLIHDKNFQQFWIKGNIFNLIKGIFEKPTANNVINSESLHAFYLSKNVCSHHFYSILYWIS